MKINSFSHKKNVYGRRMESNSYYERRIGFWGEVKSSDSQSGTCDVVNEQGLLFSAVPVASKEWVAKKEEYVSCERSLPPAGTRVFVIVPSGNMAGAFILCSGYPQGESDLQILFAKDESKAETKNSQYERITQGGWNIKENYADGNFSVVSADKSISFQANVKKNDSQESEQGISLAAWDNSINITADGITVTDKNGNSVFATADGFSAEDKNGNKITTSSSGMSFEDANGNKIEMASSSVKINGCLEVLQ